MVRVAPARLPTESSSACVATGDLPTGPGHLHLQSHGNQQLQAHHSISTRSQEPHSRMATHWGGQRLAIGNFKRNKGTIAQGAIAQQSIGSTTSSHRNHANNPGIIGCTSSQEIDTTRRGKHKVLGSHLPETKKGLPIKASSHHQLDSTQCLHPDKKVQSRIMENSEGAHPGPDPHMGNDIDLSSYFHHLEMHPHTARWMRIRTPL